MAYVEMLSGATAPAFMPTDFAFNFGNSFYLTGSGTPKIAYVFQAPVAGDLEYAETYVGFAGGASAVKVSFQDVDSSGNPDGTADAYVVIASPGTGWISSQLTSTGAGGGALKTVTRGQRVAVVWEWNATQSGSYEIWGLRNNGNNGLTGSGTYPLRYTGGAWTHGLTMGLFPNLAIKYSDGAYYHLAGSAFPLTSITQAIVNTGTTPDEIGLRFSSAAALRVSGVWTAIVLTAAADVVLYDSDGTTVLASSSLVAGYYSGSNDYLEVRFATSVELDASTVYRLALKPTSGSDIRVWSFTVNTAGHMAAHVCGADWHYTARTNAGSWTETTTRRPFMGLILDGVDSGGSSSSGGGSFAFVG